MSFARALPRRFDSLQIPHVSAPSPHSTVASATSKEPHSWAPVSPSELEHGIRHFPNAHLGFHRSFWPSRACTDSGNGICSKTYLGGGRSCWNSKERRLNIASIWHCLGSGLDVWWVLHMSSTSMCLRSSPDAAVAKRLELQKHPQHRNRTRGIRGGRTFLQDLQGAAHPLCHDTGSLAVKSRIA